MKGNQLPWDTNRNSNDIEENIGITIYNLDFSGMMPLINQQNKQQKELHHIRISARQKNSGLKLKDNCKIHSTHKIKGW